MEVGTPEDVSPAAKYRAVAKGAVRCGAALDSERVGELADGDEITVTQRAPVGDSGEMWRVRFEGGWASVVSKKGRPLLVEVPPSAERDTQQGAAIASGEPAVVALDMGDLDSLEVQQAHDAPTREAAIAEIQRLELRARAIADAYLSRSIANRLEQLRGAARDCERDLDALKELDAAKKGGKSGRTEREEKRKSIQETLRHVRIRIAHAEDEHNQVSELAARSTGAMAELLAASPSVEPRSQLGGGDDRGVSLWLPAELEGGIVAEEERKVTNRFAREAEARAVAMEQQALEHAEGLVSERWGLVVERTRRADVTAAQEYEQAKVMGDAAAKVMTDAKRKSQILMKSDMLAKHAKSTVTGTNAFKSIAQGLGANQSLNAREFLAKSQMVVNEVLRQQHEIDAGLDQSPTSLAAAEAAEEGELQSLWRKLDLDQSGTLEPPEVRKVLVGMGRTLGEEAFQETFRQIDVNSNGKVEYAEFLVWWQSQDRAERMALRKARLGNDADAVRSEFKELAGESERVQKAMSNTSGKVDDDIKQRLASVKTQGSEMMRSATNVDSMVEDSAFINEIRMVVVDYIQTAVAGIDLPTIGGSKDWGAYEITGLAIQSLEIAPENVKVEVDEGVTIRLLNIQTEFDEFAWSFEKATFPRMKDAGQSTAQVVDLSAVVSFNLITDEQRNVTVDNVEPVITLGELNVKVSGGSHTWLYNKLLKLFSERIKTTVQNEMQGAIKKGVGALKRAMAIVLGGEGSELPADESGVGLSSDALQDFSAAGAGGQRIRLTTDEGASPVAPTSPSRRPLRVIEEATPPPSRREQPHEPTPLSPAPAAPAAAEPAVPAPAPAPVDPAPAPAPPQRNTFLPPETVEPPSSGPQVIASKPALDDKALAKLMASY